MRSRLLLCFTALSVWLLGCPPAQCDQSTCTGCCDSSGVCQPGDSRSACGASGSCSVCAPTQQCSAARRCESPSSSGGGGGGGSGGGGGQATGGSGGGAALTLTSYRAGVTSAVCAQFLRCGRMSSEQGCLDSQLYSGAVTASYWDSAQASVTAGRMAFDPALAQACLDFIRDTQPCDFSDQGPCAQAFRPLVADGAACFLAGECAAASYCTAKDPSCPGTCQPRKALGAAATSVAECVEGAQLYAGTCIALVSVGGSCAPSNGVAWSKSCVSGAFCSPSNVCQAQAAVGAGCASAQSCLAPANCVEGVCRALLGPGQVCRYNVGESCLGDLHCERPRTDVSGVCTTYLGAGAPCSGYGECKPPLVCTGGDQFAPDGGVKGHCTAPLGLNAPCRTYNYQECGERAWCRPTASGATSGTCAAPLAFGQPCTGSEQGCPADGYCEAGTCRRYFCAP